MEKNPQQRGQRPGVAPGRGPGGREAAKIARWLKQVRFKRALFGVSEKDVWKKIGELNELYRLAILAERARCDALLEQQREQAAAQQAQPEGKR